MYKYCKLEALDKSILHSYDGRYFTTQGSLKLTWYLFLAKKVMIFFFLCVCGGARLFVNCHYEFPLLTSIILKEAS